MQGIGGLRQLLRCQYFASFFAIEASKLSTCGTSPEVCVREEEEEQAEEQAEEEEEEARTAEEERRRGGGGGEHTLVSLARLQGAIWFYSGSINALLRLYLKKMSDLINAVPATAGRLPRK
jgi:hypothetical protein